MIDRRARRDRRRLAAACGLTVAWALGPGCSTLAPKTSPGKPTPLMKQTGATMSAVEMRQRVDDMVPPLLASIEQTTDRVRAEADDPEVRRRALLLKIDAVPVVYRAAFQPDPLAAMLDLWLLSYQMEECLDVGTGPCALGAQQPIAREAGRALREAFEAEIEKAATNPDALAASRARVRDTARRHPLTAEGAIAGRRTMTVELARAMGAESRDAFAVIGDVSTTLTELTNRLNTYIGDAGRLGRWHAELLVEDLVLRPEIAGSVADLHRVADSVDEAANVLEPESLDALIDRPLAVIPEERRAVLADIDRQRVLTLRHLTAERVAALEAVHEERVATMAQLHQERIETMEQVDALRREFVGDSVGQAFRVVDHLVWRLAQLLSGLLLLAALLTWLVLRTGRVRFNVSGGSGAREA
jgi:hypothetical protein